jgi:hypothetical protein
MLFFGSGDCPIRVSQRCGPKRWNEAISVADFRAQSPSLSITVWRAVRDDDAKATELWAGVTESLRSSLSVYRYEAPSPDSRRYRKHCFSGPGRTRPAFVASQHNPVDYSRVAPTITSRTGSKSTKEGFLTLALQTPSETEAGHNKDRIRRRK